MESPISRLLTDEHVPDAVGARLRLLGHDVKRVRSFSRKKQGDGHTDLQVVQFALDEDRVILTENCRDFLEIHKSGTPHAGIIASKVFEDLDSQAKHIDAAIRDILRKRGSLTGEYVRIPYLEVDLSKPEPLKKGRKK